MPIALTLGDPCGIGPELWVRILCAEHAAAERGEPSLLPGAAGAGERPSLQIFGDEGVLERAAAALGLEAPWQRARGSLVVHGLTHLSTAESRPGQPSAASGAAQVRYLTAAISAAQHGDVLGLCTAPIHKAGARAAGLTFPGHTELLAEHLGAAPNVVMMLAGPSLRVALCTTHVALSAVPGALSIEGIAGVLRTTALALHRDFGITAPRLHVAGLNPHAGEGGHFGDEEARLIRPAIQRALELPELRALPGLVIEGPLVPDVVFRAAVHPPDGIARPDAVVAMYHDQGLIPLKLLDFDRAVNVTLGLSVVRTSPDHGVAYDLAGQGRARPDSQHEALRLCVELVRRRAKAAAR